MFAMTEPQCISNTLYKVRGNRVQEGKGEITSVSKYSMPLLNFNLMWIFLYAPFDCAGPQSWSLLYLQRHITPSLQWTASCHASVGWGKHGGGRGGKVGLTLPGCKACSSFKSEMPVRLWHGNMCSLEQSSVQAGGQAGLGEVCNKLGMDSLRQIPRTMSKIKVVKQRNLGWQVLWWARRHGGRKWWEQWFKCRLEWTLWIMRTDLTRKGATLCTKYAWPSAPWSAPLIG